MTRIPRNRPTLCGHSVCGQPALYAIRRLGTCMELKLGVGPASHAEDVQKEFHDMIGGDEPMAGIRSFRTSPSSMGYTVAHLWHKGSVGERPSGDSFPSGTWVSAPTSPVSDSMYGEVGWNLVDALGTTALREGLNAASTVGVGPVEGWSVSFFAGLGGYGSATICSTARCSRTAGPSTRSPSSARACSASPCDMGARAQLLAVVLHRCVRNAGKGGRVRHLSVSWYF